MALDLDAIKARCDAATKGPWELGAATDGDLDWAVANFDDGTYVCGFAGDDQAGADAQFVAHARADVPALLAEVEHLRADRDRWKAAQEAALAHNEEYGAENERLRDQLGAVRAHLDLAVDLIRTPDDEVPDGDD